MIDTNAIRAKTADVAVTGDLTADYKSKSTADSDLNKMGIVPGDVSKDEIPYKLKDGWRWVRVVDLGADTKNSFADGPFGSNLKREHYTTEKQVRIIQLSNVGELGWKGENEKYTTFEHLETIKRSEVMAGNIVIAKMMPAGRAIIVPEGAPKYVLSSDCVKFVPNAGLNTRYLCYSINSQMFRKQVLRDVHGIGRERTSLSKLKSYLLPIPPTDEQKIIVERIDAIYDLLKEIDELQLKYESDLSVLKGKIVDAGIRGKLTEQLPEDGDAETLYSQIQEEKARLIKESKIKKEKPLPEIYPDEIPFDIPKNWKWVRLQDVCSLIADVDHNMPRAVHENEGKLFLSAKDLLDDGTINYTDSVKYISEEDFDRLSRKAKPQINDIIYSRIGAALGKARIVDRDIEFIVSYSCCVIRPLVNAKYLRLYLESTYILKHSFFARQSIGVPDLGMQEIKKYIIAIPPLSEQKRIASKIEAIMKQLN